MHLGAQPPCSGGTGAEMGGSAALSIEMPAAGTQNKRTSFRMSFCFGASDEARTRYLHLGKVALYQMSYTRGDGCYSSRDRTGCQLFSQNFLKKFARREKAGK